MVNSYIEWRKVENLRPITLTNKEKFYFDLTNIEQSWSGREDILTLGNTFIMEAEQQLINAIELFEQGYFDCAYYSLRSAVEISTTIVFLADMPDEEREHFLNAWKETKDFPMQGQMIGLLSHKGNIFSDMKEKMPDFFIDAKKLSADLNKYVHKQGLTYFYISRNHPFIIHKPQGHFADNFEYYLKKCIGVVAVMRLAIDPFPILLMDEEIFYRCFNSITEPYSAKFVNEYIGQNTVEAYKTTEIYQGAYKSFIKETRKTEAVFNVVRYQYIDSRKLDEIFSQLYLMTKNDIISVLMVYACDKIVKTYCSYNLPIIYFTEKNTKRKSMYWSGLDLKKLAEAENNINQPYDEAYISVFKFDDEIYYVEHNEQLVNEDLANIIGIVTGALFKMTDERSLSLDPEDVNQDTKESPDN